jgi:predicted PurR-regulated permease PerM
MPSKDLPAVVLVVALAFSVVFGFALVVAGQLTQVAQDLPGYKSNIQTKIRDIKVTGPNSLFARITGLVEDLGEEVAKPAEPLQKLAALPPVRAQSPSFNCNRSGMMKSL